MTCHRISTFGVTFELLSKNSKPSFGAGLSFEWDSIPGARGHLGGQYVHKPWIGSAKTDPVQFKRGFGEGLLKDKFAFFEAHKSPIPKRRKLLAKRANFYKQKGSFLKKPFKLDRVSFSLSWLKEVTPNHVPSIHPSGMSLTEQCILIEDYNPFPNRSTHLEDRNLLK